MQIRIATATDLAAVDACGDLAIAIPRSPDKHNPRARTADRGSAANARADVGRSYGPHIQNMDQFDFNAPAEIFSGTGRWASRRPMTYHRFSTGAEAIRFAIEVQTAEMLAGTVMEAGEARFGAAAIRALYESFEYSRAHGRHALGQT